MQHTTTAAAARRAGWGALVSRLAAAVVPVIAASLLGNLATQPKIPTWYATLAKPSYTPPNWLFPVAWTLLFTLMAIAVWRILAAPPSRDRTRAAVAFYAQLAVNILWSFAFFGAESPSLGLLVIGVLLAAILGTIALFRRVDRLAAALLVPYALWVSYATAVNAGVVWLNT